ncbi:MAG TPA: 16S rRNA methyltransferase [Anaerolineae bacterium]|jgi:16S rRNA (guanine(1405)-N(7))-methyltransferase
MRATAESPTAQLDRLAAEVKTSAKYRYVCDDLVRSLGAQELGKRDYRDAVKAVKNKLHQVGGAYLDHAPPYATWLMELQAAQANGPEALRAVCSRMMGLHASTRERLPILQPFYADILGALPPIHSVLDVACGFNPLAIPWMPLAPQATYTAIDIYADLMDFLAKAIDLCGPHPVTLARSVLNDFPEMEPCDLALLLKAIPCLEQVDRTAGARLLDQIQARYLLISFPVHSLGGRSKGMASSYESHFSELVKGKPWSIRKFVFATELAFLVTKRNQNLPENCL